jgi:AcrR family transcriptional regulator
MRPSKRGQILDAALAVVEREGLGALTYESLAAETGLTKGGLLYHFPSRDALVEGLHRHVAGQWEASMEEAAGKPAAEATVDERLAAYTRVAAQSSTHAELLLLMETAVDPAAAVPWDEVDARWSPPTPTSVPLSEADLRRTVARLAADGLWLNDTITGTPMSPEVRAALVEHLVRYVEGP